jgi:OOP family OmpA-OmpF porin
VLRQKLRKLKYFNFDFNKWSVELSGGLNKPMRPMSAGYRTAVTSVYVADLGVRYMFNNKFGLKQTSDTIALKKVKTQFDSKYYRIYKQ